MLGLSEQWRRWIKDALGLTEHIEVLYNPSPMIEPKPELKQKEILFAGNGEIEKGKAIAKEYGIEKLMSCQRW